MSNCKSEEIALKSFFLGPQAENREWVTQQINNILRSWFEWRRHFKPEDGAAISAQDMIDPEYQSRVLQTDTALKELAARFEKEIPKFSPRYIGHMFSEISLPALFGHILTVLHNPNNISHESSIVGTAIENEAIEALSRMMGFSSATGHFTSGGTVANFEAVYRARARLCSWLSVGMASGMGHVFEAGSLGWAQYDELKKKVASSLETWNLLDGDPFEVAQTISRQTGRPFRSPVILVPEHKHYSWVKAAHLFGLGADAIWPINLNREGRLEIENLKLNIEKAHREDRPVMMVISVLGTTELGMIDPVDEVQNLLDDYAKTRGWHLWHHVDAAYGGFLCSLLGSDANFSDIISPSMRNALGAVKRVHSVTLDPHKLGYVPYASGAFLCRERRDYFQRPFGGPYVDFHLDQDKGPFTIEGSRSATGAVATWMTAKCVGLNPLGYGAIIARTIHLRQELETQLSAGVTDLRLAPHTQANLLGFCLAKKGETLSQTNARTLRLHGLFSSPQSNFFVSKTVLHRRNYTQYFDGLVDSWQATVDRDEVALIRLCLMNPFLKSSEMNQSMADLFVTEIKEKSLELL